MSSGTEPGLLWKGRVPPPSAGQGDLWVNQTTNEVQVHDGRSFASQVFPAGVNITAGAITMTAAASKLVPGATSFAVRNNADDANNVLVADAGGVTLRNDLAQAGVYTNTKTDAVTTAALSVHRTTYTFSAATITGTQYGHDVTVTYSGTTSIADLRAGAFVSLTTGAGSAAQAFGVYGRVSNTGGGTIAFAVGHYGVVQNTGAGAITAGNAFYAYTPNITAGTIGTAIGYNAENQGQAGITNAYGIRVAAQSGAATDNIGILNEGTTQLQGSVTFAGTGLRVLGDFTNATLASRLAFQTSTANSPTKLGILPSGSGTQAVLTTYNAADPDNAGFAALNLNGATVTLQMGKTGTGTDPTTLNIGGTFATILSMALATGLSTFNYGINVAAARNVQIGGAAARGTTEPTNALNLFNGTAPVGTLANGATFYAAAGEMRVMDSGGTSTLLSPHDDDGLWVFDSTDTVEGSRLLIDVEKLLRALNDHLGTDYVHEMAA